MIAKRMLVCLLSGLIAGACSTAWAQAEGGEEAGGIEKDTERARIQWADHLRYDAEQETYYLEGNVVFSHKDIKLYCDKAVYDYEQDTARAEGNPRVEDPNTTITGNYVDADFDKEIALVTENVTVVTQKKKPEGEEDAEAEGGEAAGTEEEKPEKLKDYWEKKTTITCDKIEYQYNEDVKIATATSRVKAVQEDKTVYAASAVYEEIQGIITLTGDVRIITKGGNEFRCPRAVISTEEDWIQAEGVVGVAKREDETEEEAEGEAAEEGTEQGEEEGQTEEQGEGEQEGKQPEDNAPPVFGAQPEQPPAENQ